MKTHARRPPPDNEWARLVRYYRLCVEREVPGFVPEKQQKGLHHLALDAERLLLNPDTEPQSLELDAAAVDFIARSEKTTKIDQLRYGWPIITLTKGDGTRMVGPLLLCEAGISDVETPQLFCDGEIYINPSIFDYEYFDEDVVTAVEDLAGQFDPEDPSDVAKTVGRLIDVMGLTGDQLDPERLSTYAKGGAAVSNSVCLMISETTTANNALLRELTKLEKVDDWQETAAAQLIHGMRTVDAPDMAPLIGISPLNDRQIQAVDRMRWSPLTVLTGPPGTGKSQVVANSIANSWMDDLSVLIASTNNGAVDEPCAKAWKVDKALVARTGSAKIRDRLPEHFGLVIAELADGELVDGESELRRSEASSAHSHLHDLLDDMALSSSLGSERSRNSSTVPALIQQVAGGAPPYFESLSRAHSISRTVLLIPKFLGGKALQRRIAERWNLPPDADFSKLEELLRRRIKDNELKTRIQQLDKGLGRGFVRVEKAETEWVDKSTAALKAVLVKRLTNQVHRLSQIAAVVGRPPKLKILLSELPELYRAWACTTLSVGSNFDLKPGLFDLAIIDEATQCTIASALPVAYRAKRIAVIGDPLQLPAITQVSPASNQALQLRVGFPAGVLERRALDYRENSLYEAFAKITDEELFIEEHYRCHPLIARWCNEQFYSNRLKPMTDVSKLDRSRSALQWVDIDGVVSKPGGSSWENVDEANAVVAAIAEFIDGDYSIGVVTPFRGQANLIERLVRERWPDEEQRESIQLMIGTAHKFQGQERDHMFMSAVVTPQMSESSAKWVENNRNLVNVAVSRSRSSITIFGHSDIGLTSCRTLASLRIFSQSQGSENDAKVLEHSDAETALINALTKRGLPVRPKVIVEGMELDMAVITPKTKLDIEVDGGHHKDTGGRLRRQDVKRDRILRDLGWRVLRVPDSECRIDPDKTAKVVASIVIGRQPVGIPNK